MAELNYLQMTPDPYYAHTGNHGKTMGELNSSSVCTIQFVMVYSNSFLSQDINVVHTKS
jgi:hypothetical protein